MDDRFKARLAVEALRNGVPNREAVRKLGCNQPRVEGQFANMLDKVTDPLIPCENSQGMLVSGDFGTGKSHLLSYLEQLALSRGYVCSKVSISKETPLYDLGKVFLAAIENGRIPDKKGRFIEEIAHSLKPGSDQHTSFFHWTEKAAEEGLLSSIFPASVKIHELCHDQELLSEIEAFWSGDRVLMKTVRDGLKLVNQYEYFKVQAPKVTELPLQRLRFTIELIKAAGYKGWVILLDEIELMGSYSLLQRGRSYSEIARWMGKVEGESFPGLLFVGAVTDDFALEVISPSGRKKDWDYIPNKVRMNTRYFSLVPKLKIGMELLQKNCLSLESPSEKNIQDTVETLRNLYQLAFDWFPPAQEVQVGGAGEWGRMRYKVRSVINEWDLKRLFPDYNPEFVIDSYSTTYDEDTDLENSSDENEE
ncbi:MAG: hypothetical protein F4073_01390 [Rhodobacteraceae bacterium]|nr:hypothetical protein [Paracoccaceae bacterium]MYF46388.1 hypothetical protein [Paracoccaceae bacterium]MYI90588.1 hypothetical protein [Paracoccaceae bacterium]